MSNAAASPKAASPKLTAEQKRRVRELIVDEGATRAEAVAWVLALEPKPPIVCARVMLEGDTLRAMGPRLVTISERMRRRSTTHVERIARSPIANAMAVYAAQRELAWRARFEVEA